MGIKGLPSLIKNTAGSSAVGYYPLSKFKGFTVAIDVSTFVYKIVIAMRTKGKDMVNKEGELTSHLLGIFYKILNFIEKGVTPIFVFDGKPPKMKDKILEMRKKRKERAEQIMEEIDDKTSEDYIKSFKQSVHIVKKNFDELKIMLDLMGIPYISAPGEADVVCSWLSSRHDSDGNRYAKGVCSEDSDMLVLGAKYLFRGMFGKNNMIEVFNLNKTLANMNLTMEQFINLGILLGCDYCDEIKGIGPKKAYHYVSEYDSLEEILEELKSRNYEFDEECLLRARDYFNTAVEKLDHSDSFVLSDNNIKLRKYQFEELMDFMCIKHNFDITRIQKGIERLNNAYNRLNVTRENTSNVHKIILPRSENYIFKSFEERIEFLSSDDSGEENEIYSKRNTKNNLIQSRLNHKLQR